MLITAALDGESPYDGVQTLGQALGGQDGTFETVETDEDDTAVILYTSGTTGQPKGAELRHRNMRDNATLGESLFQIDPEKPETFLCVLPLFHSFGQTVIQNGAAATGGKVVMLPRFEAGPALQLMQDEEITFFAGVPTMYWGLLGALKEAGDSVDVEKLAANLRIAAAGGSALPVEVHKSFREKFGVTILEGYGLSETSPVASFSPPGEEPRVGSIGIPIPGVEMKLIDPDSWDEVEWSEDAVGEIAIKGHNIMKGYYGRPDATEEAIQDGWFRSGDLGRRDADGWYYIVDRSKDMIIRGGYNVYPREIEEVLMTHPDVSLAAVIGVPHDSHGEEVKAVVILEDGASLTEDELVAWGKEQMAGYKYPRIVEFVDSLPMTATGKILKRELSSSDRRTRPRPVDRRPDGPGRCALHRPGARLDRRQLDDRRLVLGDRRPDHRRARRRAGDLDHHHCPPAQAPAGRPVRRALGRGRSLRPGHGPGGGRGVRGVRRWRGRRVRLRQDRQRAAAVRRHRA